MHDGLTDRQRREREFYSAYSRRYATTPVDLDPVRPDVPPRPWNPYWYCCRRILEFYGDGARRLLDLGCGWGDLAIRAAHAGFSVHAIDITPENIRVARKRANATGVADRLDFSVGTAERPPYAQDAFDVIVGIDILHHVQIPETIVSCHRLLRPGGRFLFKEPVRAPVFDALRSTRVMRAIFPNSTSLDRHITPDERKLDREEVGTIERQFPGAVVRHYRLLSRANRFLPVDSLLERADMLLLQRLRIFRPFAGFVVIEGRKLEPS